jgi:TonB family protein
MTGETGPTEKPDPPQGREPVRVPSALRLIPGLRDEPATPKRAPNLSAIRPGVVASHGDARPSPAWPDSSRHAGGGAVVPMEPPGGAAAKHYRLPALPPDDQKPRPTMPFRSRRLVLALLLSVLVHIGVLSLFTFQGTIKMAEPPKPIVVEMQFAALGKPEGAEEAPKPPPPQPAPPPPEPTPPPPPPQPAPPPPPLPKVELPPPPPEPAVVKPEPAPEPAPPPEPVVRPLPKPEPPPKPPAPPPPKPTPAPPPPQPAPPQQPAPAAPAPAAPVPTAPRAEAPAGPQKAPKGIETGVAGARAQDEMSRYVTTLFTMIDRKKEYPSQSLRRREQGTVSIRLTIARDGKLLDVTSPTKSPERLVEASLQAVHDAAPFPPLPRSLDKDQAVFEVPVTYRLQ